MTLLFFMLFWILPTIPYIVINYRRLPKNSTLSDFFDLLGYADPWTPPAVLIFLPIFNFTTLIISVIWTISRFLGWTIEKLNFRIK